MRVLHVLAELHPSGAESMLLSARAAFLEHGVDGEILSTGRNVGPFAPQLAAAGYRVHHLPFAKTPRFFLRVYELVRDGSYDVVHLHTERANFWFGLIALAGRPKRVVRAVHNVFPFTGGLRLRRRAQRRLLSRFGVVYVAVGTNVQEVELAHFGVRTRLIPNWYDSGRFASPSEPERRTARESLGLSADETVLVSIGHCSQIKNHTALIEALARLPGENLPVYLHVGTEEPGRPEHALAEKLGVSNRIRFLGSVDDVRTIYFAADIFVMPSLREGRSIAALEALGTGLPVLLADVEGLRDLRGLYPALSYAQADAGSIAETLTELMSENPATRRERAVDYPTISRDHFGVEAGVVAYTRIYRGG
jgi:glycosyltransferase involved in cell wall biosynthesis